VVALAFVTTNNDLDHIHVAKFKLRAKSQFLGAPYRYRNDHAAADSDRGRSRDHALRRQARGHRVMVEFKVRSRTEAIALYRILRDQMHAGRIDFKFDGRTEPDTEPAKALQV